MSRTVLISCLAAGQPCPSLLTTAACSGLRPEPDCRPRRTFLHLSYSCATPFGPAILVTQDAKRTLCGGGQLRVRLPAARARFAHLAGLIERFGIPIVIRGYARFRDQPR